jgi:LysM repeat protein
MNNLRQVAAGFLAALFSSVLILGSFALVFTEGARPAAMLSSGTWEATPTYATLTPSLTYTSIPTLPPLAPGDPTYTPSATPSPSQTPTPTSLTTPTSAAACHVPSGWFTITVRPGDTLESLAAAYNSTPNALYQVNCLVTNTLPAGALLYVPGVPPTQPPSPCGPPRGWILYTVLSGDTLYSLSKSFGVTVSQLQFANCLGSSTNIRAGSRIYVLNVPTRTPILTRTFTPVPTVVPTATPSPTQIIPSVTALPPSPTPVTPTVVPPSATPIPPSPTPITPSPSATPITPVSSSTPVTPDPSDTPVPPDPSETPVTPDPSSTPIPPEPLPPTSEPSPPPSNEIHTPTPFWEL